MNEAVYYKGEGSVNAFLLEKGKIEYSLPDGHSFEFSGEKAIFGTTEILLGWENEQPPLRLVTVTASSDSVVKPVPRANLRKLIEHYHVGFNINQELARQLREVNRRIQVLLSQQGSREKRSQKYARGYAELVDRIHEAFHQLRFPFLKELYDEFSNSLTYPFGKCLMRVPTKAVIHLEGESFDSLLREYPEGMDVCRQGEPGDTLFILKSGMLGIYLGDLPKPVAIVTTPGEVIGEMSLLLDEPRTATMRAESPLQLSAVARKDLQQVVAGKPDFFLQLGTTLSQRIVQALDLVDHLIRGESPQQPEEGFHLHDPHQDAFRGLERRIMDMLREHDFPVMHELQESVLKIRSEAV